jgi:hypothetical protein
MKRVLSGVAVMLVLASAGAQAQFRGERYLGTINVFDGGSSNNCETTTLDAGRLSDGGLVTPDGGATDTLFANAGFAIPSSSAGYPITVVCATDVRTLTGVRTCTAATCPPWFAAQWLPTGTTPIVSYNFTSFTGALLTDGGLESTTATCSGGLVAIMPLDGGSAQCQVFAR